MYIWIDENNQLQYYYCNISETCHMCLFLIWWVKHIVINYYPQVIQHLFLQRKKRVFVYDRKQYKIDILSTHAEMKFLIPQ